MKLFFPNGIGAKSFIALLLVLGYISSVIYAVAILMPDKPSDAVALIGGLGAIVTMIVRDLFHARQLEAIEKERQQKGRETPTEAP